MMIIMIIIIIIILMIIKINILCASSKHVKPCKFEFVTLILYRRIIYIRYWMLKYI